MPGGTTCTGRRSWTKTDLASKRPPARLSWLVMRLGSQLDCLSGERGSIPLRAAWRFNGQACSKGASCTCNAAEASSILVLSTMTVLIVMPLRCPWFGMLRWYRRGFGSIPSSGSK